MCVWNEEDKRENNNRTKQIEKKRTDRSKREIKRQSPEKSLDLWCRLPLPVAGGLRTNLEETPRRRRDADAVVK